MDTPNPQLPPVTPRPGPSETEIVAARRRLNRWRMGCMILFTLSVGMGVGANILALASGVEFSATEWGGAFGVALLSLPVVFGWLRWNRALGRTLIAFGAWFFIVAIGVQYLPGRDDANIDEVFRTTRLLLGVLMAAIFLLGGLRVRRAARIINDADPAIAPVAPRPIRDFFIVAICAAIGLGLSLRSSGTMRTFAGIRTYKTCAENLRTIAVALRDYQTRFGVRPPSLDHLREFPGLSREKLHCSVHGPRDELVSYGYDPEAGTGSTDIVVADTGEPHGPAYVAVLTGDGKVLRGKRETVDREFALAGAQRTGRKMAESVDRGENASLEDRMRFIDETRKAVRTLSPQQQDDMNVLTSVVKEFAVEQDRLVNAYTSALDQFTTTGGIGPRGLTSRDAIAERRRRLDVAREAQRKVFQSVISTVDDLKARIGPDRAERDPAKSGIASAGKTAELTRQIAVDEAEILGLFESVLTLLDDTWGAWRHDPDRDVILFDVDERVAEYRELMDQIDELSEHQQRLQKQLADRIRNLTTSPRP